MGCVRMTSTFFMRRVGRAIRMRFQTMLGNLAKWTMHIVVQVVQGESRSHMRHKKMVVFENVLVLLSQLCRLGQRRMYV